jgi:hypothetical protein
MTYTKYLKECESCQSKPEYELQVDQAAIIARNRKVPSDALYAVVH